MARPARPRGAAAAAAAGVFTPLAVAGELLFEVVVDSKNYATGSPGSLEIYLPRNLNEDPQVNPPFEIVTGEAKRVRFRTPPELSHDVPIMINWVTQREMLGDSHLDVIELTTSTSRRPTATGCKPQPYRALAGSGRTTLAQTEYAALPVWTPLYDAVPVEIGRVCIKLLEVPQHPVLTRAASVPYATREVVGLQTEAMTRRFMTYARSKLPTQTNIDYLADAYFTSVILPPIGRVPLWSFPLEIDRLSRTGDSALNRGMFQLLARTAKCLMNIPKVPDPVKEPATAGEFIAQMCLAPTRYLLYVRDSSKRWRESDTATDEWMRLGHQRYARPDLTGYDCEDGASQTYELLLSFIRMPESAWSEDERDLAALCQFAKLYTPLFCVGTIALGPSAYTYHAFVMMISTYDLASMGPEELRAKYRLPSPDKMRYWEEGRRCSPILMESTTRSTSCWAYDEAWPVVTTDVKVSEARYAAMHPTIPVEGLTNVTVDLLRSHRVYRHLCFAFASSADRGYLRYDFYHNSKRAAPLDLIMSRDPKVYQRAYDYSLDECISAQQMYQCMPPIRSLAYDPKLGTCRVVTKRVIGSPATSVPTGLRSSPGGSTVLFDACYRRADYDEAITKTLIAAHRPVIMEITEIDLPGGCSGIHVRGWSSVMA